MVFPYRIRVFLSIIWHFYKGTMNKSARNKTHVLNQNRAIAVRCHLENQGNAANQDKVKTKELMEVT